jgi:hypothetical protein
MKKALIFLLIIAVIAAEFTFITCFHSDSTRAFVSGTSAIVLYKIDYAYLRAHIEITAQTYSQPDSNVTLTFPDGSQKNITRVYSFDVFLPRTGNSPSNFMIKSSSTGIDLSDSKPISIAVLSNVTDSFFTDKLTSINHQDEIDIYAIKVQGLASIEVNCYGLGI